MAGLSLEDETLKAALQAAPTRKFCIPCMGVLGDCAPKASAVVNSVAGDKTLEKMSQTSVEEYIARCPNPAVVAALMARYGL